MKKFEEIIKQKPVYLHNWKDKVDVIGDFEDIYLSSEEYFAEEAPYSNVEYWLEKKDKMKNALEQYRDVNILFATYGYENYSGDAFVLFEKDGKLYEVNGGHCSCYGLEGQWDAEETNLDVLKHRLIEGELGKDDYSGNTFYHELKEFLGL